jgi:serine/threonine protein kinase
MEFLAGHSLGREIVNVGPLEPRRALSVAIQIARGLAAAHQAGIIHRDLKPDNVFVVPADVGTPEQIKILDFGIARVAGRKTRLTAAGSVVGTPEYMSPEQARGDDLDLRSDIYALGVVLFELLTGRVPLSGDSMVGTLTKQVFELPPPIREIDPRFAGYPSIEAALARLLAKNRDERPPTALDAASLLATAAANDLEPVDERHEQAVLAGWSQPHPIVAEPDRPRRSTIMIGSGAITSAHEVVEAEGPRAGSFATKQGEEAQLPKRPSVIVTDAPAGQGQFRPARVLQVTQIAPPPPPPPMPAEFELSNIPTPPRGSSPARDNPSRRAAEDNPRLGKPSRGGLRRRHLPLILVGIGAAIFAALVTIGFVRWWQDKPKSPDITGMTGSPLDARHEGHIAANTHPQPRVEPAAREIEHFPRAAQARPSVPDARIQITRESRVTENAVR